MSGGSSPSIILRVYSYEPGTKTTKQKRTLELPTKDDLSTIDLGFIRGLLSVNGVFESPDATAPFCNTLGAEMSDDMTFKMYLDQLDEPEAESDTKADSALAKTESEPGRLSKASKESSPVGDILKVYYKKKKVTSKMDDAATDFLKKQLDLKLQEAPQLKDVRAELLASAFKGSEWKALTPGDRHHAANLTERDWSVLMRTNCLLSGFKLVTSVVKTSDSNGGTVKKTICDGVARTPFNAFKLKPRIFKDYEVAAPPSSGNGAKTSTEKANLEFHIPRFRVDDAANIDVVETRNTLKKSLAESSFSKTSLEASMGGGFWGVSAAAKGGFANDSKDLSVDANTENHHDIHVTYNFPRVSIFLDETSLELTPEVMEDIPKVRGKESLKAFGNKYGDIFSRQVKVGGKLTSTNKVNSKAKTNEKQRENALKVSAALSFSGLYGSGGAEGSLSTGDKHKDGETTQEFDSILTWHATGGDATLSNDPPSWCGTVGNFYNWRVVEHDNIISLAELISTFKDFKHVQNQFERAAQLDEDDKMTGDRIYL
ncbi:hypothetical protein BDV33DRAFT_199189 [Aspergillus novoparasiticus]|uniref:MACPF-like domain-containing protein n=1 Tax=Aspergillus novoparasiticus TaxID=986946 RepID=A0A5N6F585_9EURO|nr:hypothetical protein BDV33DRAFT_199189 [Aspergillus novoparasiticus]